MRIPGGRSPASAHLFTAKERDDESGLDYFLARYYSSSLGRFTGADAPFADQSPGSPQSWNLYGYVRNNPLKATDPTGRAMLPCGGEDEVTCPASADEQFEQAKQQYNSGNYVGAGLALLGAVATKFDLPGGLSPNPVAAIKITSAMGAKGAAALADTAETISKADDSVTLFRAVMPGEAADLAKTQGAFRNPKGIEGKYFSETLEGAESYASQASQAFGDGPFSFVETTIPKGAIDPGMRALPDRGIPTVVVPTGKLPLLSPARSVVPR